MAAVVEDKKQIIKGGSFLIEERTPEDIFTPEDFTEEQDLNVLPDRLGKQWREAYNQVRQFGRR